MSATVPVVSVCCITYNHEAFIAQAIESVLMQQTDFPVELVIGLDHSTDGTDALAQEYARRYPDRIRLLVPPRNQGSMTNLTSTLAACNGEFTCTLEGDDYWTDPTKLQRQVQAMRARPDATLCFHDAEVFYEDGATPPYTFSEKYPDALRVPAGADVVTFTQHDLGRLGWFIPSASMFFRTTSLPKPLPAWFKEVFSGDYTLQLLSTRHGVALYLPRVMSRYRLHSGGVMQTSNNTLAQNGRRIFENERYRREFDAGLRPFFNRYLEHLYFVRSEKLGATGHRWQQLYFYLKAISVDKQRLAYHARRLWGRLGGGAGTR